MLDWEDTKTGTPTAADYEVQENYYQRLWNQNQDDIVNGLGSNTLVQGSDEWYDILKKGDDLLEKRDAYRMGKMGMLGSDDSTGTSATSKGGGGFGIDVNLDANDTMMYTGQPGFEDGENIYVNINDLRPAVEDPVVVPKPDPTKEIYVYISEDDFNATMESLLAEQEEQLTELWDVKSIAGHTNS